MNDPAQQWVENAARNVRVAALLQASGEWQVACFHAQQSVELALKAAIIRTGVAPPRVHALLDLFKCAPTDAQDRLRPLLPGISDLDDYYMPTRYPDMITGSPPGEPEAMAAVAVARQVLEIVRDGPNGSTETPQQAEGGPPEDGPPSGSP